MRRRIFDGGAARCGSRHHADRERDRRAHPPSHGHEPLPRARARCSTRRPPSIGSTTPTTSRRSKPAWREQLAEIAAHHEPRRTRRRSTTPSSRWSAAGSCSTRVSKVFFAMTRREHQRRASQKLEQSVAPKLAAHQDAIYLDARLYARIKALYEHREAHRRRSRATSPSATIGTSSTRARAVAARPRRSCRAQQGGVVAERPSSRSKLLAATKAGALVDDTRGRAPGPRRGRRRGRGEAAAGTQASRASGSSRCRTRRSSRRRLRWPDRATRERLFKASTERTEHGDANDTRAIVQAPGRAARAQGEAPRATRRGRPTCSRIRWRGRPRTAIKLLTDMVAGRRSRRRTRGGADADARRQREAALRARAVGLAVLRRAGPQGGLRRSTTRRSSPTSSSGGCSRRRVLRRQQALRPHVRRAPRSARLPPRRARLRGERRRRANRSRSSTRTTSSATTRTAARGWTRSSMQAGLLGTHPVVFNVCNFTKPAPGQPALSASPTSRRCSTSSATRCTASSRT